MSGIPQKIYALYIELEGCADFRHATYDENFDGTPLPEGWKLPKHIVGWPKRRLNDFVQGYTEAPFVSERAKSALEPVVGDAVQFKSIGQILKRDYYILNVIRVVDCLDEKKSRIVRAEDGRVLLLSQAVFDQTRLPNAAVFKVPESTRRIYVTDRFVDVIREHRLTGVGFEPSDNVGLGVINNFFPDLPLRSG